jgi:hypothetical protein
MRSPVEQSPEHLVLIGTIIVRWASLDLILVRLLSGLLNNPIAAERIYFSSRNQKAKFDMIRSLLLAQSAEENSDTLINILNKLSKLASTRNDLVHSYVVADGIGPRAKYELHVEQSATKSGVKRIKLSLDFLQSHADTLSAIGTELTTILDAGLLKIVEKTHEPQESAASQKLNAR